MQLLQHASLSPTVASTNSPAQESTTTQGLLYTYKSPLPSNALRMEAYKLSATRYLDCLGSRPGSN